MTKEVELGMKKTTEVPGNIAEIPSDADLFKALEDIIDQSGYELGFFLDHVNDLSPSEPEAKNAVNKMIATLTEALGKEAEAKEKYIELLKRGEEFGK